MKSLPWPARVYLIAVYFVATLAAVSTFQVPPLQHAAPRWELGLFSVLALLFGSRKIRLTRLKADRDAGSMSVGFVITFASMLRFGPQGAMIVGGIGCLASCLYPKRQPLHQLLFNEGVTIIETAVAGTIFLVLNGGKLALHEVFSFPAIIVSCAFYFLINTGGVAIIIALCTQQKAFPLWKETFLWTCTSYLTGACASSLALILFDRYVTTILLFVSPAAYLTFQLYSVYTARAEEKQQHIEELQYSQAQLADLYLATIKSLALAIDAKDQYTHQHILRVQRYAVATAKLMDLSDSDLEGVNTGALLHDIGKLGVPEYVLLKPGRLTEDEFAKIKKHPEIGAAILDPVEFPWPVLPVVKYHHEKWDGTGYPEGLKGENIPKTARILAVADVYDALTSNRSYRNAWTHEKAIDEIRRGSGTHFDPDVVEAFLQVINEVVQEMAENGEGPLAQRAGAILNNDDSKATQAARDIQRASSELWALYEVAQTLSSSLGLQETLDILARKMEAIFPNTGCVFLLRGETTDKLYVRAAVGVNQEFFRMAHTLNLHSISLRTAQEQSTYLGVYDPEDLLLASCQSAQWVPFHTAMIVPIIHQGEMLGTMNLYHTSEDAFTTHDMQLIEMITERAAMALYNGLLFDRTRSHAFTDPLTGLNNIRFLTEFVDSRCQQAQARYIQRTHEGGDLETLRYEDTFALLCLDLDSFKPINDNFGHQKGDQVLRDLADIFRSLVRPGDVVARYGGDEFLVVLDKATAIEAEVMAERIQQAVGEYDPGLVHPRLGELHLGVSVGYACYPRDGGDCGTLLSIADAQMYRDKTERKLGNLRDTKREQRSDELVLISA